MRKSFLLLLAGMMTLTLAVGQDVRTQTKPGQPAATATRQQASDVVQMERPAHCATARR